ncbi:MAG: hypothetical protein R2695_13145 [Acidimicrobiales bacterium]
MPGTGPDESSRYYRWDDHPYRLQLVPGTVAGVSAIGWELTDDLALDTTVARLEAAGATVKRGSDEEAAARLVSGFATFTDPAARRSSCSGGRSSTMHGW